MTKAHDQARERAELGLAEHGWTAPGLWQADGSDKGQSDADRLEAELRWWGVTAQAWRNRRRNANADDADGSERTTLVAGVQLGDADTGHRQFIPVDRFQRKREYRLSPLPIFTKARVGDVRPEADAGSAGQDVTNRAELDKIRLALYSEAMANWRTLTDVRFRLFGMLPALSIVAFVPLLLVAGENRWLAAAGFVLALLGLALAHGLHMYEARNDGLYDDLLARARRIEAELGIETGLVFGRLARPHPRISHGRATMWIFGAVKMAWIVVALVLLLATITPAIFADDSDAKGVVVSLVESPSDSGTSVSDGAPESDEEGD